MRYGLFPLFIAMHAFVFAACAPSLVGKLTDPSGQVVSSSEARVNITSLDSSSAAAESNENGVIICKVDGKGRFESGASLKPGTYLIEALVPGYELTSQKVTVEQGKELVLVMKPLTKAKAAPIGIELNSDSSGSSSRGAGDATLTPPQL